MISVTDYAKRDQGPGSHDWCRRVFAKSQLARCQREPKGSPLEWDAGIQ